MIYPRKLEAAYTLYQYFTSTKILSSHLVLISTRSFFSRREEKKRTKDKGKSIVSLGPLYK